MALSISTVWEVRASGASDNNGGGFVVGSGGTDYSQQNAAQASGTDLACTTPSVTVTSASALFTAAMVGNIMQIRAGTNFTTGFYQIATFVNTTTITLDRTPCPTTTGSGGTWAIGGALLTLGKVSGAMVASNKAWATGAFTTTATITFAQANISPTNAAPPTRLIGYGATRGDATHATLTLQTNTGLTGISVTASGFFVEQMDVDCASLGTSTGISVSANSKILNCKVSNFTLKGLRSAGTLSIIEQSEATAGTSAATFAIGIDTTGVGILRCYVHDNACPGISLAANSSYCSWSIVANNSGASSDGILANAAGCAIMNNTIHNSGRDGIRLSNGNNLFPGQMKNNILTSNAGFGINSSAGNIPATIDNDGNAYFSNTSGNRNNLDNTTTLIFPDTPYVNVFDKILTGSPYVGPTTGGATANFMLNKTAGAGGACRGTAQPGAFPGNTATIGYLDMGAVQSQGSITNSVTNSSLITGATPYIIASAGS